MNTVIKNLINTAHVENVQKLSVGAAIIHENKLLLLKRCSNDFMPNIYELPGGGLELGESLIDALKRELIEEANCTIDKILGYIGHIDFQSFQGLLTRRFNFLIKPKLPIIVQLTEHEHYIWIYPKDAAQYKITPQTKKLIALVNDNTINYF